MFKDILKCSIVLILLLRTVQGSPRMHNKYPTVADLTARDSDGLAHNVKFDVMRRYMNASADPCEDFYEFACGNYAKFNPFHPKTQKSTLLQTTQEAMEAKIKAELELNSVNDTSVDRKLKYHYWACMNLPAIKSIFKDKLMDEMMVFGQMPVLVGDQWQENDFDWALTLAKLLHDTGISLVIGTDVIADFTDNTITRLVVAQPGFTIPSAESVADNLQKMLGVEKELAEKTGKEIFKLQIALMFSVKPAAVPISELLTLMNVDEAQAQFMPAFDLKKFLKLSYDFIPDQLLIQSPYIAAAVNVLEQTPKEVVANYIFYNYLSNFMYRETPDYCVQDITQRFTKQVQNMMYRRLFTDDMKTGIYSMWRELKTAFRNILLSSRLNWLQEDTSSKALDKLKAMRLVINGYEQNDFEQEFSQLKLYSEDYVQNTKSILLHAGKQSRASIHQQPKPVDLGARAAFSPYYAAEENAVKIPVSVLQPFHLWSKAYHGSINFASLGSLIAQEMIHGFDDKGRLYGPKGNVHNWWDADSVSEFDDRAECFADQYSTFIYAGSPLPKKKSQSANIADNGGIRLAYEAYMSWFNKASKTNPMVDLRTLPGFDYNNKQVFFISYAQVWCANVSAPYQGAQAYIEPHAPEKYRVIGPLLNYDEFAKEFECPSGIAMNPLNKCELY